MVAGGGAVGVAAELEGCVVAADGADAAVDAGARVSFEGTVTGLAPVV